MCTWGVEICTWGNGVCTWIIGVRTWGMEVCILVNGVCIYDVLECVHEMFKMECENEASKCVHKVYMHL